MENNISVFHNDEGQANFESYSHEENGFTFWYATDLMGFLHYENWMTFNKAISKAMASCNTLNISLMDNFIQIERNDADGKPFTDFKLSRFACYLTVMNASTTKPEVAKAQVFFATLADAVQNAIEQAENLERVMVREEISEREKSLTGVARAAGLENYAFFQNAGYRGMYNKNISQLKAMRRIDAKKSLLEFMGKEELAANLFRVTQTELKIKNDRVQGQMRLEATAENVGRQVRASMIQISGVAPEALPKKAEIKDVKKNIKAAGKNLAKLDKGKKKAK